MPVTALRRASIGVNVFAVDFCVTTTDRRQRLFGTIVCHQHETKKLFIFQSDEITKAFEEKHLTAEEFVQALIAFLPNVMRKVYREAHFFNKKTPLGPEHGTKGECLNDRIPDFEARFRVSRNGNGGPNVTFVSVER